MSSADEITFRQEPSLGGETFVLRRDRIIVREVRAGEQIERHIPFSGIAAEIELTDRRFTRYIVTGIVFAVIFGCAAWKMAKVPFRDLGHADPTPSAWMFLALATLFGGSALGSVIAGFVASDPIAVARVRGKDGKVLFELFRHQNVAAPFEEFLLQLRRQLADSQS